MSPRITPVYKTNSASPFSKHSLRANPGDSLPLPSPSLPPPPFIKEGLFWDLPGDTAGSMDSICGGKTEIPHAVSDNESRSVVSDSLRPRGLYSPWSSPGQNTGVGSHSLLQGILPIQGSNIAGGFFTS